MNDIHQQAVFLPLWGSRIPYVLSRRLDGFVTPTQVYTFSLNTVRVLEGSKTVTVAPGASGALFASVGPMNPHQYFPNMLFASDWMYEGLVRYGSDGEIIPALASSWNEETTAEGQRVTFQLRENVFFHDGSEWNCTVAKLNMDHILSDTVRARHSWYGTPTHLKSWTCDTNEDLVLETSTPYYPLLQELTYTRPLVFASANAFAKGFDSDPDLHNSCNPGHFGSQWDYLEEDVVCAGLSAPLGTGPFRFVERTYLAGSEESIDETVVFARHDQYWGTVPDIEELIVKYYATNDEVFESLLDGTLDMALGTGPLSSQQVRDLQLLHSTKFDVTRSEVLQNAMIVLNTNRVPTNSLETRKAIIHAVNKAAFLNAEFADLEQPVSQLLPLSAPYCDVDLNPKWSYDFEKAFLLNCPAKQEDESLSGGAIAGIAIGGIALVVLLGFVIKMVLREKQGKPIFRPDIVDKGEANWAATVPHKATTTIVDSTASNVVDSPDEAQA